MSLGPQQKDTTYTKIFVGGLPYHTTDDSLRNYFAVFGDIEEAVVITDRQTGKSRGYGFVTMTNKEDAARACKDPNPIIDGRKANVNLAYIGAKPRLMQIPLAGLGNQYGVPLALQGVPRVQYPSVLQPAQQAALQQAGLQLTYAGYPQTAIVNPQMLQLQQQQVAAANSAAQIVDPSGTVAYIDPATYAALLQQQAQAQYAQASQQQHSPTHSSEQNRNY